MMMGRYLTRLTLICIVPAALLACSRANSEAPPAGQVHEQSYLLSHGLQAKADPEDCKSCHGSDLRGREHAGNCLACHPDGEPIALHPMPFIDPALHGTEARKGQNRCSGCHGSSPIQFDGGTLTSAFQYDPATTDCSVSGCHDAAEAHPTCWQGTNDTTPGYQASHRAISREAMENACALCHQVAGGGPQPRNDAPSCFAATFTNADGSTTGCHSAGPGAVAHAMPYTDAQLHGTAARDNLAGCVPCHATPADAGVGGNPRFNVAVGNLANGCETCHAVRSAHPTRWQGTNDTTPDYIATHRATSQQAIADSCAMCHDVVRGNPSPNPNAPSCFAATFTNADGSTTGCHSAGPGAAAHAMPFTDPQLHGPAAKNNLAGCVPCHATPADAGVGGNPRFNVAVGNLANGCETCHAVRSAHPTPLWTGPAAASHKTANLMGTACALCHGTGLNGPSGGGVGPACTDCHTAGSPLSLTDCSSCHNQPPDGQTPAGDRFPNRDGAHAVHIVLAGVTGHCETCHQNTGTGTDDHFTSANAAGVSIPSAYDAQSGVAVYDSANQTCSATRCHGGQTTPNWWSGSLDVATQCASCHSTSSGEYNSATSGEHRTHGRLSCTACHDAPTDHFSDLATTGFEGDPAQTIQAHVAYNGSSCDSNSCHGAEQW
jgi:predicted CxxxxCH...CXXCH cytochrome family protein